MLTDEQKRTIWRNLHPLQGYGTDADLFALSIESAVRAQCEGEQAQRVRSLKDRSSMLTVELNALERTHELALDELIEERGLKIEAIRQAEANAGKLREAVRALYYAAVWHADRPVDEAALWTAVRDAAGFEPGQSPAPTGKYEANEKDAARLRELLKEARWCIEGLRVFGNDNIHKYDVPIVLRHLDAAIAEQK